MTLKKRLDGLAKPTKVKAGTKAVKQEQNVPAPSRASRLIVRNLPFDITEQDLRAVFLPYGPIHSIHIPVKPEEPKEEGSSEQSSQPRGKGYAFVWMLSKKDAEKALDGANGTKVRAGLAEGLVRDKQKKKKLRREEAKIKQKEQERKAKRKGKEVKEEGDDAETDESDEENSDAAEDEGEDTADRQIAVDWALSKDKWEEVKAKQQSEAAENSEDEDAEGSSDESEKSDDEDSHIGVHDGSGESGESEDDDDEMDVDEDEEKPGKPQLPPPETGTTLFVRNVPFEATEDDLRTLYVFSHFYTPSLRVTDHIICQVSVHLALCDMHVLPSTSKQAARGAPASHVSGIKRMRTRLLHKATSCGRRRPVTRHRQYAIFAIRC